MKSQGVCKIYFPLLVLCYLEVVLWTACLLTSATLASEAAAEHRYLQRETGNLKWFAGRQDVAPLFDELELATDLHTQLEHLSFQHVFGAWSLLTTCSVQQSHLHSLRTLPDYQGLPAPYSGVKNII